MAFLMKTYIGRRGAAGWRAVAGVNRAGTLADLLPSPVPGLLSGVPVSAVDSQVIGRLFQQHGAAVYRRALRILGNPADAEEATQEIFIRVVRSAETFKQQSQLTTWLYQITTNYCLNQLRDRKRRTQLDDEHLLPSAAMAGDSAPARSDDLAIVRHLLSIAPEQQAKAAACVYLDGMSHEEAAEVLGVSKRTVGNLLDRFSAWAQEEVAKVDAGEMPRRAEGGRS
jgi:RNA polymerase sigma-70 factor (ECF subfamily)